MNRHASHVCIPVAPWFRSRRALRCVALIWAVLFFAIPVRAHDPLEITATLYFRSNQVELFAEMELRPARVLAEVQGGATYEEVLERMNARAASCFKLLAGGESLAPSSASALAAVENHVQLRLLYPRPAGTSFQVAAPLLDKLAADGPYGVSLTVLDMVNQKVMGQSVLFADRSASPLMSVPSPVTTNAGPTRPSTSVRPALASVPEPAASAAPAEPQVESRMNYRWVLWLLAGTIVAGTLWWSALRKRES